MIALRHNQLLFGGTVGLIWRWSFIFLHLGCQIIGHQDSKIKIISGSLVKQVDPVYKSTVALSRGGNLFCTGALIDKRIVLTAAHCLVSIPNGENLLIQFGSANEKLMKTIAVAKYSSHSGFNASEIYSDHIDSLPSSPKFDIGLIVLEEDAPDWTLPVAIPQFTEVNQGMKVILAGYGRTDGVVKDISGNMPEARGFLRKIESIISGINGPGREIIVSPSEDNPKGSSCHGDSGGPMFQMKQDGSLALLGLTSRGYKKEEDCRGRGIYTDVRQYTEWIKDTAHKITSSIQKNQNWQHEYFEAADGFSIALDYKLREKGLDQEVVDVWINLTSAGLSGKEKIVGKLSSYVHSLVQEEVVLTYAGDQRFTGQYRGFIGSVVCARATRWGISQDLTLTVDGKYLKPKNGSNERFEFKFCN